MNTLKTITTKWTGIRPLIMHNGQTADQSSEASRKLRALNAEKKSLPKGNEDALISFLQKYADVEWETGLYYDETDGAILPSDVIERCIQEGAQKLKQGKAAKAAVFCSDKNPSYAVLEYDGPRDLEKLKANHLFRLSKPVVISQSRVVRTRPYFPRGWSATFELEYDSGVISEAVLIQSMQFAGSLVGVGDWRPKYGRFSVEIL